MKSKKERALEVAIEQELLKRGKTDVEAEFMADAQNPNAKRSSTYTRIRLNLMLKWSRPQIR